MVSLLTWEAMPQPLPSPTLTNPDMILPDLSDSHDSTPSPRPQSQRPPSPSHLLRQSFQLSKPPPGRRSTSASRSSTRASNRNSTIFDPDATPKTRAQRQDALASLNGTTRANVMENWQKDMEKKASDTSLRSTGSNGALWAGFEGSYEDESSAEDVEGRYGTLPYVAGSDEETDNEQWEGQDDEELSSAALSKRAEMILANAKKRLNLMEGNLRGARQSLVPTPHSHSSMSVRTDMSSRVEAARDEDRHKYPYLSTRHSFQPSPLSTAGIGHNRGRSETFVQSPQASGFGQRVTPAEKRATSALGSFRGPFTSSPLDHAINRSTTLRGTRSHEVIRHSWIAPDQSGSRSVSRSSHSHSSPRTLDTLPEDDDLKGTPANDLRRSASTTSDLRAQMQDLKGRISSLKERAREDGMKRRSMQNLRTPSPFTAAPGWQGDAEAYRPKTAGVISSRRPDQANSRSANTSPHNPLAADNTEPDYAESHYEDAAEATSEFGNDSDGTQILDELEESLADDAVVQNYGQEIDADSLYDKDIVFHDAEVTVGAHEDRPDAFDYEHFFLHSAMGSYSREKRSPSVSSEGSVETTRPASPPQPRAETPKISAPASVVSPHRRTRSQESISTIATFATATEGTGSDEEEDDSNEALDQFTQQALGHHMLTKSSNSSLRTSSSGQRPLKSPSSFYSQKIQSAGSTTPEYLNDSTARIMSSFFSPKMERGQLTPLKQKDEDLLYALTTSIQQVCIRLQGLNEDDYETRVWRQRMEQARKILDGVPSEHVSDADSN